jgi:CHAT domain-containing protein
MSQQRYYELIYNLLTCNSGEEEALLMANPELLNSELVKLMQVSATTLAEQGHTEASQQLLNWLEWVAQRVEASSGGNGEEYEALLRQILQEIYQNYDNRQSIIYSILAQNLPQINLNFANFLRLWVTGTLAKVEKKKAESIASLINSFSNLIDDFPLGNVAANKEIAIAGYESILQLFTREAFPVDWAMTQNNLGSAYQNRILGERSQNLELAIAAYKLALEVRTREAFPVDWATTQNNLGSAYLYRILGERSQNLELAIAAYELALEVYTREAFPVDWAMTQNNLGSAYQNRILGERSQNLELAIAAYKLALEVRTREAFPVDWATTQNNLGSAYLYRILGERSQNLELAIAAYELALEVRTREAFPVDWATTQNNLGSAYLYRILGERSQNLELAIAAYELALEVRTREAFPVDWAMTQNNLGSAYQNRILGERSQNLELAIAAYELALEVRTREAFPVDWATTQNNLGSAYQNRILGERSQNLELAIAAYELALEVRTREAFPVDWAMTQNNLGIAYSDRILGERSQNLELAIAAYKLALEVRTREAFPVDWAMTQNNLGIAYSDRILGERSQNLELAIAAYKLALEVRTREAFPVDWAMTQNNLGIAYSDRILGERSQNLELAIAAYKLALEVRTREAFPVDWATTQNNLGSAYLYRILGERSQNLELAIAAYKLALEVRTREAFPVDWATTQNNLGSAYQNRILGERSQNLELAIAAYKLALEVRTREAFPVDWAMTQNNLGSAYQNRILGERSQNLELAIEAYQAALTVHTPLANPFECLQTGNNLGILGFQEHRWDWAILGYSNAVAAIEQSLEWSTTEAGKIDLFNQAIQVYEKLVQAYLNAGETEQAFITAEASKSRRLVELFLSEEMEPQNATPEQKQQLKQLRSQVILLRSLLAKAATTGTSTEGENTTRTSGEINETRSYFTTQEQQLEIALQNYDNLIAELQKLDPNFTLIKRIEPITLAEIRAILPKNAALLSWYIYSEPQLQINPNSPNSQTGICAFILTHTDLEVVQLNAQALDFLKTWIDTYFSDYRQPSWTTQLASRLTQLADILNLSHIRSKIPATCPELILVPHRYLHIIPFAALPLSASKNSFIDTFNHGIRYAQSCRLWQRVQLRKQRLAQQPLSPFLFGIQNPTQDLANADIEVEIIQQPFNPNQQILAKENATKPAFLEHTNTTLKTASCLHFACHGNFQFDAPLLSSLVLAQSFSTDTETSPENRTLTLRNGRRASIEKCLTLHDIFTHLNLPNCQLVTLSACETGLTDIAAIVEESIGLPAGFLYAGSLNVLSSFWCVDDFATAILMIKFYEIQATQPHLSLALKQAQDWMRNITEQDFLNWLKNDIKADKTLQQRAETWLILTNKENPFNQIHAWASFRIDG